MNLEHQVCSIEQSRRLKELGIEQKTLFYWVGDLSDSPKVRCVADAHILTLKDIYDDGCPAAFTVAELGVMTMIEDDDRIVTTAHNDHFGNWRATVMVRNEDHPAGFEEEYVEYGETEAEARAQLLLCLLENGIIAASDCNARLLQ